MKTYTKEQLVKAMNKYHQDLIKNQDNYIKDEQLDGSIEQAEHTVEHLISFIE